MMSLARAVKIFGLPEWAASYSLLPLFRLCYRFDTHLTLLSNVLATSIQLFPAFHSATACAHGPNSEIFAVPLLAFAMMRQVTVKLADLNDMHG